jgi:cyclopropane fatty-acyl-phospholipid synthase-like methyltransferase/ABC-type nitrate/sulfonate/bicarbonate transport system substrate-binding protein
VGGVPEHFNAPWNVATTRSDFHARPYSVRWTNFPGGTGAMCAALQDGSLDVAVLLADGIVASILSGNPARIIGTYVDSPLYWGIHVHADSPHRAPEDLAGLPFAISRFGSGSHLMTYVEAHARGWLDDHDPEFVPVGGLEGARGALAQGDAHGFLWERLMTRPLVDSGEWRQIGVRPSPWPAFLIAARPEVIDAHGDLLADMLTVVARRCHEMKADRDATISYVAATFGLEPERVGPWLDETRWRCAPEVSSLALEQAIDMLHRVGVTDRVVPPEALVATQICELGDVLPEALYDVRVGGVRDALARAGHASGALTYEQLNVLGDLERFYDYGTESCRVAADTLGLEPGRRVLEVGSRAGAAARFLAHEHGCLVTGVELQPALNAAARELTARCGMDDRVDFLTGDVSSIAIPQAAFDHLVSLTVMTHLPTRDAAWASCHEALTPGGTFFVEDLVLLGALDDDQLALARDVLDAPNLVSAADYVAELERAGFVDVHAQDLTPEWITWSAERHAQFASERARHVRVHGASLYDSRERFLRVTRDLFALGVLGGARFTGRRLGALEAHLVRSRAPLDSVQ